MPIAVWSNEDGMQPIATSQRLTSGKLAIPTCPRDGTPNWHHSVTCQVGIGGRDCSQSHENVTVGPPNLTNKRGRQRGKSK